FSVFSVVSVWPASPEPPPPLRWLFFCSCSCGTAITPYLIGGTALILRPGLPRTRASFEDQPEDDVPDVSQKPLGPFRQDPAVGSLRATEYPQAALRGGIAHVDEADADLDVAVSYRESVAVIPPRDQHHRVI